MTSSYWKKVRRDTEEAKVRRRATFRSMRVEIEQHVSQLGGHVSYHQDGGQVNLHIPAELLMYFPSTGTLKRHGKWRKHVPPGDLKGELTKRFGGKRGKRRVRRPDV